ncbi:MAG: esterase/lipase family protein, partial [Gammaproteobacteria bacterium]
MVEQIRRDYQQPDLKVDIVAHSMGGLIPRYFMRYGKTDVTADNDLPVHLYGAKRVRRVVLLGPPNLGSVKMLNAFIDGIGSGFQKIGAETLAAMPGLYQLLPHPLNDSLVTAEGRKLERGLFEVEIWRRFQWSIFAPQTRARMRSGFTNGATANEYLAVLERYFEKRLERARRFVWSLTVPLPEQHPILVV